MKQGRIIIITGSSGTGKTTTAPIVSQKSDVENQYICTPMIFITISAKVPFYHTYRNQMSKI